LAALAVLLAALGLYGILAYSVRQRWSEFGVRMALGASPEMLLGRVVWQGLLLTVVGLGVGLAAALALSRLLNAFLFGIRPNDATTYALVAGILLVTAGLASYLPARRAMRVDPAVALKQE
jgi:ABC-type antimicrobial peptide transport system permease subunit